jgi:SAM-dependent methyltransferase
VQGVEPSAWACAEARRALGDRIMQGFFEDLPCPAASFDVVTMWDVLEHVQDPGRAVDKANEVLRTGGVLAINVPAADSWIARIMGGRWPLLLPEHLHYFTRRSMSLLLSARGFDALAFLAHPVFFEVAYVCRRLAQHGLAPEALPRALAASGLASATVPLLMGEFTVFAQKRGHDARTTPHPVMR